MANKLANATLRQASVDDKPAVLNLMREFYPHEGLVLTPAVESALEKLLANPALGAVWLIKTSGALPTLAGYAVLTRLFSLEYGGPCGLIDELFILPTHRGQGLGRFVIRALETECRRQNLLALHLEVDHTNEKAHRLYTSENFLTKPRHFLTKWLHQKEKTQ